MTALITAVSSAYTQIAIERLRTRSDIHDKSHEEEIALSPKNIYNKTSLSQVVRSVNWRITGLLTLGVIVIVAILLFSLRPVPVLNRLVTRHDFEGTDDGWSRIATTEYAPDGTHKSEFPNNPTLPAFPGSMNKEVTMDYALTGRNSLRVTTSINSAGKFKSFLHRNGTFTGSGVTIYVFAPELTNVSIDYIQLCIPSHDWVCTSGMKLVPGEWTPITIDLSKSDEDSNPLYKQKLTEMAVQWRFNAKAATTLSLYFDSVEIFHSGPTN